MGKDDAIFPCISVKWFFLFPLSPYGLLGQGHLFGGRLPFSTVFRFGRGGVGKRTSSLVIIVSQGTENIQGLVTPNCSSSCSLQ